MSPTVAASAFFLLLAFASIAQAATFSVNRFDIDAVDATPGDGICTIDPDVPNAQCTLRAAVMEANALAGHDTIVLPPGAMIVLTLSGAGDAEAGDLLLSDDVDILGFIGDPPDDASDLPVIEAEPLFDRIFNVGIGVQVEMRGLVLQGGNASSIGNVGGAILNFGNLLVEHSLFLSNRADSGGAIRSTGPSSDLTVRDSHFQGNWTPGGSLGAAISNAIGTARIYSSSFRDNRGQAPVASTIQSSAPLVIENSTLDGGLVTAPVPGLVSTWGVVMNGVPADLVIRNSTIDNFSAAALHMTQLDDTAFVRVANSVLAGGTGSCGAVGPDPAAADVSIQFSLVESAGDCADYFTSVSIGAPQLGPFANDIGTVTWYRPASGPFSNVVNTGIRPDQTPDEPELACTAFDQRGNPRPLDGNASDLPRCDRGAIEQEEPPTFVVDHFDEDLVDIALGNGSCDIDTLVPGATCTLRAAVMEANALPGLQAIRFIEGAQTALLSRPAAVDASGGDLDILDDLAIIGQVADGLPVTTVAQTVAGERIFDLAVITERSVALRQLRIVGGSSFEGGAVRVESGASLLIERSQFEANHSEVAGGAAMVIDGLLFLVDSDLHDNSTEGFGAAVGVGSDGTALISYTSIRDNVNFDLLGNNVLESIHVASGGALTLANSTVSGNDGGIFANRPSRLLVLQSTIAGHSLRGIYGVFNAGTDGLLLANTVVSAAPSAKAEGKGGPSSLDCQLDGVEHVNNVSIEYMLSSDGSCNGTSATSFAADPLLGPLQRPPGRLSRIHMPAHEDPTAPVSPALDVAKDCTSHDQRGQMRPVDLDDVPNIDGSCDLGAVEVIPTLLFADGFEN